MNIIDERLEINDVVYLKRSFPALEIVQINNEQNIAHCKWEENGKFFMADIDMRFLTKKK